MTNTLALLLRTSS